MTPLRRRALTDAEINRIHDRSEEYTSHWQLREDVQRLVGEVRRLRAENEARS